MVFFLIYYNIYIFTISIEKLDNIEYLKPLPRHYYLYISKYIYKLREF